MLRLEAATPELDEKLLGASVDTQIIFAEEMELSDVQLWRSASRTDTLDASVCR
ncbi:MAG TPA: hypothetical protein VE083_03290 [Terriglobales bacterium]|nr:hypothetical protein [Terriglobales bacterium]